MNLNRSKLVGQRPTRTKGMPMLDAEGNVMKDLFVEDGLHMNSRGYDIWAKVIGGFLSN